MCWPRPREAARDLQERAEDVRKHAAAREEEVADLRRTLELRQIARRDGRHHTAHRLRLPGRPRRIDEARQAFIEEFIEQAIGSEQPAEVIQGDVVGRTDGEGESPGNCLLAQRSRTTGGAECLLHLFRRVQINLPSCQFAVRPAKFLKQQ